MFRSIFPEKLDFEEEFTQDPLSANSKTSFIRLNRGQVEDYFNYEKPHWALAAISSDDNYFTLDEVLNSLIDRVEQKYIEGGESSLEWYFDRDELIERGVIREEFGWDEIVRIVLVNLESVCSHLNRNPISELLEDVSILQYKSDKNRNERLDRRTQLDKDIRGDYAKKHDFLGKLINELEETKIDRQEIKRIVMDKFGEEFSTKISHMVRINGNWTIKFKSLGTIQEIYIIPHFR